MTKKRAHPPHADARITAPANRRLPGLALLAILLVTLVVYLPSLRNGFTNWDDDVYVTANPLLAPPDVRAVLLTPVAGNHHPLTILSLALDHAISGERPASYHWINLLLHLANTALVFVFAWLLSRRRFWTAAATSLFFGIHPMHVESVAWIAARKDVLYGFFYLLGLVFYLRYLDRRRWACFAASLVAFVLSLASKPAAVVFPLTLLLIDWLWQRTDRARLVLEKLPFLALSVAAGLLTLRAQQASGAVAPASWSLFERVLFAAYGSVMYVLKLFVPLDLSAVYPYPANSAGIGPGFYASLAALVVGLPALLWLCRRLRPVLFGWAFFFVNVVLVLQLVTVGKAVVAERYTYLPYIGLLLGLTWWLDDGPRPGRARNPARLAIATVLALLLPLCLVQTWTRCAVWRDSVSLWTDTIHRFPGRVDVAHANLGLALEEQGRHEEAIAQYREALRIDPQNGIAHNDLGKVLAVRGRLDEAIAEYREAIRLKPGFALAHSNLGAALRAQGRSDEAVAEYREAIRLDPRGSAARFNLGIVLAAGGRPDEAIAAYREALRLEPGYAEAHSNLGAVLRAQGRFDEAVAEYREALRLRPDYAEAHYNLGVAFASRGRLAEAIPCFAEAVRLRDDYLDARYNLGILLARTGRFDEALPHLRRAAELAPGNADLARALAVVEVRAGSAR